MPTKQKKIKARSQQLFPTNTFVSQRSPNLIFINMIIINIYGIKKKESSWLTRFYGIIIFASLKHSGSESARSKADMIVHFYTGTQIF